MMVRLHKMILLYKRQMNKNKSCMTSWKKQAETKDLILKEKELLCSPETQMVAGAK